MIFPSFMRLTNLEGLSHVPFCRLKFLLTQALPRGISSRLELYRFHAKNRSVQLSGRHQRDCARHQSAYRAQPDTNAPADFARRTGALFRFAAEYSLCNRGTTHQRTLDHRRREWTYAARPPADMP